MASLLLLTSCFEDYNTATTAEGAVNSSGNGNESENGGDIDLHTRNSHSAPNHVIQEDLEDRR